MSSARRPAAARRSCARCWTWTRARAAWARSPSASTPRSSAATRNIAFDEKIGGTFHVALGAAFPEAGGSNESALHWDMVCDLRAGGEVYGDGELIMRDGALL